MDKRKAIPGFKDSEVPPRNSDMNLELIRAMAEEAENIPQETLNAMLAMHTEFVMSGGSSGRFERLQVAGLPMNIFTGKVSHGTQLVLKKLAGLSNLSGAELTCSDFSGSICEDVNFSKAILDRSMFTEAFFKGANFEGASCRGTDFTNSDLRYANFRNADLHNADFEIANCEYADFTGAILDGASFKGANLDFIKR
jgi:uncharacterized protein YjbI with pentapeptide repeats